MALQLTMDDLQAIRGVFKEELHETEEKLNKRIDALDEKIEVTNARMDQRFQEYDEKMDQKFQNIHHIIDEKIHSSEVMLLNEMERLHRFYMKRFDQTDERIDKLTEAVNAIKLEQDTTKMLLKAYDRVYDSHNKLEVRVTRLEQVMA